MNEAEEYSQLVIDFSSRERSVNLHKPTEVETLGFPELPDDDIAIFRPGIKVYFQLGNYWGKTRGMSKTSSDSDRLLQIPMLLVAKQRGDSTVNGMYLYVALSSNSLFTSGSHDSWNTLGARRVLFRASSQDILVGEDRLAAWKVWREAMIKRGVSYSKLVATQEAKVGAGERAKPR